MYKCVIGITSVIEGNLLSLSYNYVKAITRFNAYPLIISYKSELIDSLGLIDGLLLTGGGDFSSDILKQPLHPLASDISPLRDKFEHSLLNSAMDIGMPVLGICRGVQLMNIARGGSIIQHIEGHIQKRPRDIIGHTVNIAKKSRLFDIARHDIIGVNSFHHQAIDSLAKDFKIVAQSDDGVIEAIEALTDNFAMGVQWHPECLCDNISSSIFEHFISSSIDFKHQKRL